MSRVHLPTVICPVTKVFRPLDLSAPRMQKYLRSSPSKRRTQESPRVLLSEDLRVWA